MIMHGLQRISFGLLVAVLASGNMGIALDNNNNNALVYHLKSNDRLDLIYENNSDGDTVNNQRDKRNLDFNTIIRSLLQKSADLSTFKAGAVRTVANKAAPPPPAAPPPRPRPRPRTTPMPITRPPRPPPPPPPTPFKSFFNKKFGFGFGNSPSSFFDNQYVNFNYDDYDTPMPAPPPTTTRRPTKRRTTTTTMTTTTMTTTRRMTTQPPRMRKPATPIPPGLRPYLPFNIRNGAVYGQTRYNAYKRPLLPLDYDYAAAGEEAEEEEGEEDAQDPESDYETEDDQEPATTTPPPPPSTSPRQTKRPRTRRPAASPPLPPVRRPTVALPPPPPARSQPAQALYQYVQRDDTSSEADTGRDTDIVDDANEDAAPEISDVNTAAEKEDANNLNLDNNDPIDDNRAMEENTALPPPSIQSVFPLPPPTSVQQQPNQQQNQYFSNPQYDFNYNSGGPIATGDYQFRSPFADFQTSFYDSSRLGRRGGYPSSGLYY